VVFMEPKHSYRAFREEVPEEPETMEIGKARIVQEGTDLTLVSWGAMLRPALAAAGKASEQRGASMEVVDLLTISPMDGRAIASSVRKTGRCVVVQEAPRSFGAASEVIAQVNDRALSYLEAPVRRVTGFDVVTPYFGREKGYVPGPGRILGAINEILDFH
jgi:pyruvate dehydrogenase E1 component beta subunit